MSKFKNWNKLSLMADPDTLENITAYFQDLMLGLEEQDSKWNLFFDFDDFNKVSSIINSLNDKYDFTYSIEDVEYDDWHLRWKDNFQSIEFNKDLIVIPDWDNQDYSHKYIIKIKPGMSFGTGHHETTYLMIQELLKLNISSNKKILDLGSGSGILSIIASKLGFQDIKAIEFDEVCKNDIEYNMKINSINQNAIDISFEDATALDSYHYDVILANIEKNIIMDLIPLIKVKKSKVILSGILIEQQQEVYIKLVQEGFENIFINKKGEWVCLIADYI